MLDMAGDGAVYSIGHSTRSFEELAAVLRRYDIEALADIRQFPRSRTNPQFNRDTFGPKLGSIGIHYAIVPQLGGRRGKSKTAASTSNAAWQNASFRNYANYASGEVFQQGLSELLKLAEDYRSAMMCAEALWWRCHRRIVADYLLARKIRVIHIFNEEKSAEASLTPFATVNPDGTVSYDD